MGLSWKCGALLGTALLLLAGSARDGVRAAELQDVSPRPSVADATAAVAPRVREGDWSGPRIGFMFAPGEAGISKRLRDHGLGNVVSQFGWHFEHQVTPVHGGPQLVTEITPLLAGAEYGTLVPSVTASVGVRSRGGFEIGMGPSLTLGNAEMGGSVGLVIAAGRSMDFGDVHIPLNLAVSTNQKGTMISVLAGYAIPRAAR